MNQREGFVFALHKARGLFMVLVDDFVCDALLVAPLDLFRPWQFHAEGSPS